MNVKKLFQIIIICLFKSFVQLRVHEVSVHFCDLFQHCFISVLCSQWQCHAHICVRLSTFCLVCFSLLHAVCFSLIPFVLYCYSCYTCLYVMVYG